MCKQYLNICNACSALHDPAKQEANITGNPIDVKNASADEKLAFVICRQAVILQRKPRVFRWWFSRLKERIECDAPWKQSRGYSTMNSLEGLRRLG
jgi:hypothetical protein